MITFRKNRNLLEFLKDNSVKATININTGEVLGVRGNPLRTMSKTIIEAKQEYNVQAIKNAHWDSHAENPNPALLIWDFIFRKVAITAEAYGNIDNWRKVMGYLPIVDRCAMLGLRIDNYIDEAEINLSAQHVQYYKNFCNGFVRAITQENIALANKYQNAPHFNAQNQDVVNSLKADCHESMHQAIEVMVYIKGFSAFPHFARVLREIAHFASTVNQVPEFEKDLIQTWVKYFNLVEQYKKDKLKQPFGECNPRNLAYQNNKYVVIPANCPQDLIDEGLAQHNCVGNGNYARRIEAKDIHIVFIRKADSPQKPFITCAINAESKRILSFLGSHNSSDFNAEDIAFREEYQTYLYTLRA